MGIVQKSIFLFLLCSCSLLAKEGLKKVTLQLPWFDQFQFAGYYIAKEKGYYEEVGLDVSIIPFTFGLDIGQDVSSGKTDFAVGYENLILERSKNKKIVALYALFQASPLVLLSTKESNINVLHDFVDKKIMTTVDDSSQISIKAMINSYGLKFSDFTVTPHTHDIQDLIDKKTDVISAYLSKAPFELEKMGILYNVFDPSTYGFDMYSNFLFTSETFIAKDAPTVEAFKNASLRGWEYAYQHIEESADLIIAQYNIQNLTKEELVYEAEVLKKLSFYQTTQLGKIEKEKIHRIYDLYNIMGLIENKIDIDSFLMPEFYILSDAEKKYLENKKEIKVCVDPNWMPFEKIENGKLIGMNADYLKVVESKIDVPLTLVPTSSWKESLEYMRMRKCDILSLTLENLSGKEYMNFTAPHLSISLVIATTNEKFFISELAEVINEKLGMVRGYPFEELLRTKYPDIQLVEVDSIANGLERVANGELFGFIDNVATIGYEMQRNYMGTLKVAGRIDKNMELSTGVRNDDEILFNIINKALKSINQQEKNKILNAWSSIKYEKAFDYSLFWKLLAALLILSLFVAMRFRTMQKYTKKINKSLEIIDDYVLLSYADKDGIIIEVSTALCKMTGYSKDELIGKSQEILTHPHSLEKHLEEIWETAKSGKIWSGELKNLKKDGTVYWVDIQISPIWDKKGNIEGYSTFRYDITDKKRVEALSVTDQLTQISNRLFLDTAYKKEVLRTTRYREDFSVIILDIDFFKDVNDTFGHTIGDKFLVEISKLLEMNIRQTDSVGRWGGEEFLIICPHTNKNEAAALAEKIRITIVNFDFDTVGHRTCSFGVAEYNVSAKEDKTINRADNALYKAKELGRNKVVVD